MSSIKILEPQIQNKIAAGEVVERPSSVVKELLENSLDANAGEIEIFIEESGMKEMRIVDDGDGIEEKDAPLVFHRHATSKVHSDYDLFQIRSLGFRGEALASIGAVSKVTLETLNRHSEPVRLQFDGGEVTEESPGKERAGTDIAIRELFYNTPARLKYVRSLRTEAGKIIDIVQRMALNYPQVSFRLVIDGKERLMTSGNGNLKEVINDIYGLQVARNAIEIKSETTDFTISGYIIRPEVTRSHKNYISLSVNRRHIKNFKLTQSIINGYHTLQPKDKYPIAVINMTMDPKLVDVNVHPAKIEVRLSKEQELNKLVEDTVRTHLQDEMLIPDVEKGGYSQNRSFEQPAIDFNQEHPGGNITGETELQKPRGHIKETSPHESGGRPQFIESEDRPDYSSRERVDQPAAKRTMTKDAAYTKPPVEKEKLPYLEIIGQLHGTYIIMQNDTGMYLMDQHAAQERIKYEYYYDHIDTGGEGVPLLIPYSFEFPLDDVIVIDEKLSELRELGFEIDKTGMKQYTVSRYPDWIKESDPERDISDLIDFIIGTDAFSVSKYREELSILMSCKQSIKANHYLDEAQMESLLDELGSCTSPYTCPHGRPVIIHLTTYEIERMFNRIMK